MMGGSFYGNATALLDSTETKAADSMWNHFGLKVFSTLSQVHNKQNQVQTFDVKFLKNWHQIKLEWSATITLYFN